MFQNKVNADVVLEGPRRTWRRFRLARSARTR